MTTDIDAARIATVMNESRKHTRRLMGVVDEADLRRSPGLGFRPILWHLGHVGAFEGYWILQRVKGDSTISRRYDQIFDPIKTPREDSTNLPPIPEIESYLDRVREEVLGFINRPSSNRSDPLLRSGFVFDMVIEHEYQHQETVAYLLQMLELKSKRKPAELSFTFVNEAKKDARPKMVSIPGGPFDLGALRGRFAYDNERPAHTVEVADFRIDAYPVTAGEYAEFIQAGGYSKKSLWSDAGWLWKLENHVECPQYWSRDESAGSGIREAGWRVREMFAQVALRPGHPVTGVSWYEAEAYSRFAGKRLPTETEWEKAASWDPTADRKRVFSWGNDQRDAGNYGFRKWGTTTVGSFPEGASAYGCFDMSGNVWEWTGSKFEGYPDFKAFPYAEYSELWFDGDHRVMKGGSWATQLALLRCTFRNFWRPGFRAAFAGFRCAAD